jgi:hypothetical protein
MSATPASESMSFTEKAIEYKKAWTLLAKHLAPVVLRRARATYTGRRAVWSFVIQLHGLEQARIDELVDELNRLNGTDPNERVGDGRLRVKFSVDGYGANTALIVAISEVSRMLLQAGASREELRDVEITIDMHGAETSASAGTKFTRLRTALLHGLSSAMCNGQDLATQVECGPTEFTVQLQIYALTPKQKVRLEADMRSSSAEITGTLPDPPDRFAADVQCSVVGSPFGALMLVADNLDCVLRDVPRTATLSVTVTPLASDFTTEIENTELPETAA